LGDLGWEFCLCNARCHRNELAGCAFIVEHQAEDFTGVARWAWSSPFPGSAEICEQLGRWQIRGVSWLEFLDGIG